MIVGPRMVWFAGEAGQSQAMPQNSLQGISLVNPTSWLLFASSNWCCPNHHQTVEAPGDFQGILAFPPHADLGLLPAEELPFGSSGRTPASWWMWLGVRVPDLLVQVPINWPSALDLFFGHWLGRMCAHSLPWWWGTGFWPGTLLGHELAAHHWPHGHGSMQRFYVLWFLMSTIFFGCLDQYADPSPWIFCIFRHPNGLNSFELCWKTINKSNVDLWQLRHSFTTRFLLTCIRSKLFFKEQTMDDLFNEIAKQAKDLCIKGVTVSCLVFIKCLDLFSPKKL